MLIVLMLPFSWSEDFNCENKPMPPVSGFEILGKSEHHAFALFFFGFLLLAVGLGFVARATKRLGARLACHLTAGFATFFTTIVCAGMMTYGRSQQPLIYPAAWIGTSAALLMMLEAWEASGRTLRYLVVRRRAAKRLRALAAQIPRVRVALPAEERARAPDMAIEEAAEEEAAPQTAARRARL